MLVIAALAASAQRTSTALAISILAILAAFILSLAWHIACLLASWWEQRRRYGRVKSSSGQAVFVWLCLVFGACVLAAAWSAIRFTSPAVLVHGEDSHGDALGQSVVLLDATEVDDPQKAEYTALVQRVSDRLRVIGCRVVEIRRATLDLGRAPAHLDPDVIVTVVRREHSDDWRLDVELAVDREHRKPIDKMHAQVNGASERALGRLHREIARIGEEAEPGSRRRVVWQPPSLTGCFSSQQVPQQLSIWGVPHEASVLYASMLIHYARGELEDGHSALMLLAEQLAQVGGDAVDGHVRGQILALAAQLAEDREHIDVAREYAQLAHDLNPQDCNSIATLAWIAVREDRWLDAEREWWKFARCDPGVSCALAWIGISQYYQGEGRFSDAADSILESLRIDIAQGAGAPFLMFIHAKQNDARGASTLVRTGLDAGADWVPFVVECCVVSWDAGGELPNAQDLKEWSELLCGQDTAYASSHGSLAALLFNAGERDFARAYIRFHLDQFRDENRSRRYASLLFRDGEMAWIEQEWELATASLERSYLIYPTETVADVLGRSWWARAVNWSPEDSAEMPRYLAWKRAAELIPDEFQLQLEFGNALMDAALYDDALMQFEYMETHFPADAGIAIASQGIAHWSQGDDVSAEFDLRRSVALTPEQPAPRRVLGEILMERREYERALVWLRDAAAVAEQVACAECQDVVRPLIELCEAALQAR